MKRKSETFGYLLKKLPFTTKSDILLAHYIIVHQVVRTSWFRSASIETANTYLWSVKWLVKGAKQQSQLEKKNPVWFHSAWILIFYSQIYMFLSENHRNRRSYTEIVQRENRSYEINVETNQQFTVKIKKDFF